ncbi:MAG: hypothetical protein JO101_12260 [Candidatus Eremiobacteraeota bacterium]|nr:hypothetical protein [Candidatus Eremiobacteraeota bacterium]MBV8356090.1 hypothetical protein [Candidatus Eremiobacteraeota bacterium]
MKALAVLIAIVCFILAILYWTGTLQVGAAEPGPHHKHAVLFAVLGIIALIWFRFQSSAPPRGIR